MERENRPGERGKSGHGRMASRACFHWCLLRSEMERALIAFPIYDENGEVYRAHCRSPQRSEKGKWIWVYEPYPDPLNRPVSALIFGTLATATTAYLFESHWDAVSLIDKLDLPAEIDSGKLCVIVTRGSQSAGQLASFAWPKGIALYAFPQSDEAGLTWLGTVIKAVGGCYVVEIPHGLDGIKDLNEWIRDAGATAYDIEGAIDHSSFQKPEQKADGNAQVNGEPPPLRPMLSWIDYGNMEIDRTKYHIGEGFLEVGGFIMIIGPSYAGKSTLLAQLSIYLAVGLNWSFFRVEHPLRILIVQAEDSDNKLIKMGQMYRRMELTPAQIKLAQENTRVLTIWDLQDASAVKEIERHALVFKPHIICVNPLTSYLGSSIYKDDVINKFLRVELTPMLHRLKISAIVVHHPPKPPTGSAKEPKDLTAFELQYGGAGMAALTNAPRGNVFLVHIDGEIFKLSAGKGFDDLGTKETVAYLRRSRDGSGIMLWEECDQTQAEQAQGGCLTLPPPHPLRTNVERAETSAESCHCEKGFFS
jgi:hypothetical protein